MRFLKHRRVTLQAVAAIVALVLGTQDAVANRVRVLVLEDYVVGSPAVLAAESLCFDTEVYGFRDIGRWGEIIESEPWDIILVDAPDAGLIVGGGAEMVDYLNAGGRAIVSTFNPDGVPGLENAMGLDSTEPYYDPLPITSWDTTHPVFNVPHALSLFPPINNSFGENGYRLNPSAGTTLLAGVTPGPMAGQGVCSLSADERAIFNAWIFPNYDEILIAQLLENQLAYMTIATGLAPDADQDGIPDTCIPLTDLGGSTPGTGGMHPQLNGVGALRPGIPLRLGLTDARPSTRSLLAISIQSTPIPLFGGTLFANPWLVLTPVQTDVTGAWRLSGDWQDIGSGTSLYFQALVFDPVALQGIALSNGAQATQP